jgi:pyruvate/2-oxoacid:ferredoxin oxidoreductase beta subunit
MKDIIIAIPKCPGCSRMLASKIVLNEQLDLHRTEQMVVWICGTSGCSHFMAEVEPEWFQLEGHPSGKR